MALLYLSIALGMVAALGAFVAIWSLNPAPPSNADVVEGRLRVYETGLPVSLAEMELAAPFGERVIRPAMQRIGRLLEQTMPEKAGGPTQRHHSGRLRRNQVYRHWHSLLRRHRARRTYQVAGTDRTGGRGRRRPRALRSDAVAAPKGEWPQERDQVRAA